MNTIRVRFAPSPTGPLHIGGVRTALYNYLFAKKYNGTFILRIEDTDQFRYVEGAEAYILESLKWCGLDLDESVIEGGEYGPYRQSERKHMYGDYAKKLLDSGHAYYAFDTPEELNEKRKEAEANKQTFKYGSENRDFLVNSLSLSEDEVSRRLEAGDSYVVRLKVPADEELHFHDIIRGNIVVNSSEIDDKVLLKSDGMPTYHLANIVDDHLMEISHVIRGEEWLPSLPLHVLLYRFLGWEKSMPEFAHLPLILKPDGKGKLSKRDGDRLGFPVFPIDWTDPKTKEKSSGFRERGFLPEAFLNLLAFLGWNPGTEQEIFTLDELVEAFSLERVGKAGARFDFEKAKWFNQQHLKELSGTVLAAMVDPDKNYDPNFMASICDLFKERITVIPEIMEQASYMFGEIQSFDEKMIRKKWKPENQSLFEELASNLNDMDSFGPEDVEGNVKNFMEKNDLGFGAVLPVLRLAMCGTMKGPSIFEVMSLLGRETSSNRLKTGIELFNEIKSAS